MSQQPISIIGAGLAGITLSRALWKRGIPSTIYEKARTSAPLYGITLRASTYRPLLKILDIDEATFKKRVAIDGPVGGQGVVLEAGGAREQTCFRANRKRLEWLIREGLDIRWARRVDNIETKKGTGNAATLCLQSGEKVETTCLVGADGPHSVTRRSLLPELQLEVLPFVVFNGVKWMDRSTFDSLFAPAMDRSAVIEHRAKNGALLRVLLDNKTDDEARISWSYSRAARGPDDSCYRPDRPVKDVKLIPEEFYDEVSALTDLPRPFKEILDADAMRNTRFLLWLMRTAHPSQQQLDHLASRGVFLMGDSIHPEAILGGLGANMAIDDGLDLAQFIHEKGRESVADWYAQRAPVWRQSYGESKTEIEKMHMPAEASSVL